MRAFCFLTMLVTLGCNDRPLTFDQKSGKGDANQPGSEIHFEAIHYSEGKDRPKRLAIRGTLDGPGELVLDPNHLSLDSSGRIFKSTMKGFSQLPVQIKFACTSMPNNGGRKVYDLVPDEPQKLPRRHAHSRFTLILSLDESGPNDLLIRDGDNFPEMYPMVDHLRVR